MFEPREANIISLFFQEDPKADGAWRDHPPDSSKRINPLTPELNPSAQRYLPRFLLGILIFKGLITRRLCKSFSVKWLSMARSKLLLSICAIRVMLQGDSLMVLLSLLLLLLLL
jgi:hypothetical protein